MLLYAARADRQFLLVHALRRAELTASLVPWLCGTAAVAAVVLALRLAGLTIVGALAGLLAFPLTFIGVSLIVLRSTLSPRTRAALETFLWIGRWEYERFLSITGGLGLPMTSGQARRWLAEHPEAGRGSAGRIEVEVLAGDHDAARASAAALPAATPWGRFERASLLAWLDWLADREPDLSELYAAAAAITDDDERLRAAAMLAATEARIALTSEGDWRSPLAKVRRLIGDRGRVAEREAGRQILILHGLVGVLVGAVFVIVAATP